jgi:hypothetical protein
VINSKLNIDGIETNNENIGESIFNLIIKNLNNLD